MFENIRKILNNDKGYKPYNMILCKNSLHSKICECDCHKKPGILHIINCCHQEKCPNCKQILDIKS